MKKQTYRSWKIRRTLHTVFWTIMLIISLAVIVYGVARFTGEAMQKGAADGGVGRYTATITLTDPLKSSENGPYSVIVTDIGCLLEENKEYILLILIEKKEIYIKILVKKKELKN